MSTFAVGDIHGHRDALQEVLVQLHAEVTQHDTVVFLGDYIDRGSDSKGCVDLLLEFRQSSPAETIFLSGNHEEWLLRTMHDYSRHSWLLGMGAFDTIRSYSTDAEAALRAAAADAGAELFMSSEPYKLPYEAFFDVLPKSHRDFFERLKPCHQTPECICVHAGFDASAPKIDEPRTGTLMWGVPGFPEEYSGTQVVVYGHWNNAAVEQDGSVTPARHGNAIGIDSIAQGVLTAIRITDQRLFLSRRRSDLSGKWHR